MKKLYLILLLGALFLGCADRDPYRGLQKSPCACMEYPKGDKNV